MPERTLWERLKAEAATQHSTPTKDTTIGGDTVSVDQSDTSSSLGDDHFLTTDAYGIPRGQEAADARRLGDTWAMELVKNTVISQLTGGDIALPLEDADNDPSQVVTDFRQLVRDVLAGPHAQRDDLDDLIAKAISDMLDVGTGYWEILSGNNGDIPVAQFKALDALSVQHNVTKHGHFDDPPYYQAPVRSQSGLLNELDGVEPEPLAADQIVAFQWPNMARSNQVYPTSVAQQVRRQLEFLTNSTTHANRFFDDSEIPAGILHIKEGDDQDIQNVREKIEQARGDPRKAAVVGGDGEPQWIEVGGTSLNLDVLDSQEWFLKLVLGAVGIPKQELNLVEDVNRNTAIEQSKVIYKRVTLPLIKTFQEAINTQVLPLFDVYEELGQPFRFEIKRSDPAQELATEERLRERFESGAISYNEYKRQIGEDPGDTNIEIDGMTVDYGEHPMPIVEEIIKTRRNNADGDDSTA
jgi:hypothetical protein